jgi:hypothetical protein
MNDAAAADVPTTRRLVLASSAACAAAVVILFAAVLPAEYGIDPLGTGAALGLVRDDVSDAASVPVADGLVPVLRGPAAAFGTEYRTDAVTFELGPYEYLEYKYRLATGATMVFAWEASAEVLHDFHGAPADGSPEVSIDNAARQRDAGSLAAPFDGMHGWYWENQGWDPITIRLTSAGFYADALESRSNRTQRRHEPTAVSTALQDSTRNEAMR